MSKTKITNGLIHRLKSEANRFLGIGASVRSRGVRRLAPLQELEDRCLLSVTPVHTEYRVNTYTTGAQQTFPQTPQAVAMNPSNGNYVVVWSSQGQNTGGSYDVYFQRYNAAGVAQGPATLVDSPANGANQQYANVAMNSSGNFVVTWSGQQLGHWNIYARQYNASGVAQGPAFLVDTPTNNDQEYSTVALNDAGVFVVTWSGHQTGTWQIYGNAFNWNGVSLSHGPGWVTDATNDQIDPDVAINDADTIVITWSGHQSSHWNVYAEMFNAITQPEGIFQVNTNMTDDQEQSAVAMDSSGNFTITWQGHQNGQWNIYAQSYFANGTVNGSNFQVSPSIGQDQEYPSIAFAGDGNPIITWSANGPGPNGWGVYAQQVTPTGTPLGSEVHVNTYVLNDQFYSSIAGAANGDVAIVWTSNNEDGSNFGVYGQDFTEAVDPVANNDSYSTNVNTNLIIAPAQGVLLNDTDPQSGSLSGTLVTGPTHGTLTFNADGSFNYTPNTNYVGTDSFTYQASDGLFLSNIATVSITVNALPPVANNDLYSTNVNTPLNVAGSGVLGNDTDPQGRTLNAVLVSGPSNGVLTLNSNGSFTYTPNTNYAGTDSFTYQATDGLGISNIATVSLNVLNSSVPVANNDIYATNANTVLNVAAAGGVLGNDTSPLGGTLTAVLVSNPSNGVLTLNSNGSFTYAPNLNYVGSDSFTYQAYDGLALSNVATVSLTVNPLLPVANNDSYSTNVNTTLNIASSQGVLLNDTDPQGLSLGAALVSSPAHGTVTLNANGSFSYTPAMNYTGSDSFTYHDSDGLGISNVATVSLTVNSLAPVANSDSYSTNVNTTLNIASTRGVLLNDTDPQGLSLSAILVSDPSHGTLTLNTNGSFTYAPNANYFGPDGFTYRAYDGMGNSNVATVSLTINALPPVANNDFFNTRVNSPLTVAASGVLSRDTDPQALPLTAVVVTPPAHGTLILAGDGGFTYAPASNFTGADSFTYKANDGLANSNVATVNLMVNSTGNIVVTPVSQPASSNSAAAALLVLISPHSSSSSSSGSNADAGSSALAVSAAKVFQVSAIMANGGSANSSVDSAAPPLAAQVEAGTNRTLQVFAPVPRSVWQPAQDDANALPDDSPFRLPAARMFTLRSTPSQATTSSADDLLDVLSDEGERIPWTESSLETTLLVGTGVLAGSGYVLLNSRVGLWLLGLLTARPLWKQFDPLEVLYAWDDDGRNIARDAEDEETLMSLVD
jgi:hypothetical protein